MKETIILIVKVLFVIALSSLIIKLIFFYYLNRNSDKIPRWGSSKILPLEIMLPSKLGNENSFNKKINKLSNVCIYIFYASVLIAFIVTLYGRSKDFL
jgi:hypothetical protein